MIDVKEILDVFVKEQESNVLPKFYVVVSKDRTLSMALYDKYKTIFRLEILTFDNSEAIYVLLYNKLETLFYGFINREDLSTFLNANLIIS